MYFLTMDIFQNWSDFNLIGRAVTYMYEHWENFYLDNFKTD